MSNARWNALCSEEQYVHCFLLEGVLWRMLWLWKSQWTLISLKRRPFLLRQISAFTWVLKVTFKVFFFLQGASPGNDGLCCERKRSHLLVFFNQTYRKSASGTLRRCICPGTGWLGMLVGKHINTVLQNEGPVVFLGMTWKIAFSLYAEREKQKFPSRSCLARAALSCVFQPFATVFWNITYPLFWRLPAKINILQQIPPQALPAVTNFQRCVSPIALQTVNTIDSVTTRNKWGGKESLMQG